MLDPKNSDPKQTKIGPIDISPTAPEASGFLLSRDPIAFGYRDKTLVCSP